VTVAWLVRHGVLTAIQAERLQAGKADELAVGWYFLRRLWLVGLARLRMS
jgi:hypothetical protein